MELNRMKLWVSALALASASGIVSPSQAPIQVRKGANNSVVLEFRGIRPAYIEVFVGDELVATRHVQASTQQVTLALSSWGLAPGTHEATIKVFDSQGRLIGQTRAPIELQPDPNAPITVVIPRNGARVAGVIPIEVRLNAPGNQYVTFFVNGQVRALRNYPPYIYHWDTTQEPNGWHTIEAWSFDGSQTFRTPTTRVFVNNPGGRTERQLPQQSDEQAGWNEALLAPSVAEAVPERMALRPAPHISGTLASENRLSQPAETAPSAEETPVPPSPSAEPILSSTRIAPSASATSRWRSASEDAQRTPEPRLSRPTEVGDPILSSLPPYAPTASSGSLRLSQAEPEMRGQKLGTPKVWAETTLRAGSATPAVKGMTVLSRGMTLPTAVRTFDVVLNDRIVVSDVQPQVENGLPLVTLRHPMEQAGAEVEWSHEQRVATVRFAGRELKVEVDAKRVLLDGREVRMEAPPRIVRGRILLPPWVLCEMLNADLLYDASANQLIFVTRGE